MSLEQLHAQGSLQPADVVADCASGEAQFLSGVREILVPSRYREHAESGQSCGA
jgi:hypothetical protein